MTLQGKVWTINPLLDERWPAFVDRHPKSSIFHTIGWLHALRITYGYEPIAFTTSAPSEQLTNALLFCVVQSWLTGNRLASLPFSDHCEPLVTGEQEFSDLTAFLGEMRKAKGLKYMEIRCSDHAFPFDGMFSRTATYCLHKLDLRPDLDTLYRGLHKNCIQRKIRRAEREKLTYEVGVDKSLIDRLYYLLRGTRARHRLPPQPIEWFRNLVSCLGSKIRIRIASQAGRPIAGILTLSQGKHLIYKYGASDAAWNHLGGMTMLLWEAIKEAKQSGHESLDLGRSDMDSQGLIAFKDRWAAKRTELTTWRTSTVISSLPRERLIMQCAKDVFCRLPRPVQSLAGRLLYRHVG